MNTLSKTIISYIKHSFVKPRLQLFYDTNCFPLIPPRDLRFLIRRSDNFITSSVKNELDVWRLKGNDKKIRYVYTKKGEIKNRFSIIDLGACEKHVGLTSPSNHSIRLKESPLICSAYYTWLPSAINPAIVTDMYRHIYNGLIFSLNTEPEDSNEISMLESSFRVREINAIRKLHEKSNRKPLVSPSWVLRSRKKRLEEYIANNLKLADYQTVVSALLYTCYYGTTTTVLTCDRDLIDIKDNLYRTIIERYSIYKVISKRVKALGTNELELYNKVGIDLNVEFGDLDNEGMQIADNVNNERKFSFIIMLYRKDLDKVFFYEEAISLELRDFILEYKKNLDCYSLNRSYQELYNISYYMYPDLEKGIVKFHVFPRRLYQINTFDARCEDYCKYVWNEKNDPKSISDFFKDD